MQLFQQWLQVVAARLHLEELEEQKKMKRRQKENGGKTKNKTTENAVGQTVIQYAYSTDPSRMAADRSSAAICSIRA